MANTSPIWVWITGGTLDDREQVRSALRDQPVAAIGSVNSVEDVPGVGIPGGAFASVSGDSAGQHAIAEKAVRESQRLISIGRMSAEIVHEINNPLESVGNLLYLALQDKGLPEQAADFLRTAESELQRVIQISKQTLSFSRESAVPISIRVADLMDEVTNMYSRRIRQKQLTLLEEYSAGGTIVAVPGEIRQVFSNLVTNAIEACSKGGKLCIRIREAHREAESGVRITVCDNGVGIAESVRTRIGEIFFTTKGESGTGLGLWVTKAIVSRYGGVMRLHSSTGKHHGTTFSVFLPTAKQGTSGEAETSRMSPSNRNVTEISRHPKHANNVPSNTTSMPWQREG